MAGSNYMIRWSGDSHLVHYGIKGQQWGLRRFQNEDGTLTEEGKDRYSIDASDKQQLEAFNKQISTQKGYKTRYKAIMSNYRSWIGVDKKYLDQIHKEESEGKDIGNRRRNLQEQFIKNGYSKEQAQIAALKKYNTEKAIKIAAGVALTAALAYGVYKGHKLIKQYSDVTIKQGTTLHRITTTPLEDLKRTVFVSPDKRDLSKYQGLYGRQLSENAEKQIYDLTANAKRNLKIAGEKQSRKEFDRLLKTDREFGKDFENIKRMIGLRGKNDYEKFNQALGTHTSNSVVSARDKFYAALKKKGYDGLIDINDRRLSNYNSKNPAILFDFGKNTTGVTPLKINSDIIDKQYSKAYNALYRRERNKLLKKGLATYGAVYAPTLAGSVAITTAARRSGDNRRNALYREVINKYKKEHPNTQLTDDQILYNLSRIEK